ncbi:unnamed protein product [Schistosoma intercalatum]|nr:unnamed protein product [Schistosoma intercalatum]
MERLTATIISADMHEDIQQKAVETTVTAIEKYTVEKDIAAYIKMEFDKYYHPTWHCIVGKHFGSYVTHELNCFIYFYIKDVAILLYKCG